MLFPSVDSNISVKSFGFSGKMHNLCNLAKQLKDTTEEDFKRRLEQVKAAREHYTYPGVIKQLEKFFADPLGPSGGDLVCVRVPDKDHRMKRSLRGSNINNSTMIYGLTKEEFASVLQKPGGVE